MARFDKTVFISYRRADWSAATLVFQNLSRHGFDVFIDFDGLASGDFEHAILENIRARAHFVVLLTPDALDRCDNPDDWLRREMEAAMAARRNVVPLLLDGFSFEADAARQHLQGQLAPLSRYNALSVPHGYFDDAMERLRSKYLAVATDAVLHPPSEHAQRVAEQQQAAAKQAMGEPLGADAAPDALPAPPKPRKPRVPKAVAPQPETVPEAESATERGVQWVTVTAVLAVALGGAYVLNGVAGRSVEALKEVAHDLLGAPDNGVVLPATAGPPSLTEPASQVPTEVSTLVRPLRGEPQDPAFLYRLATDHLQGRNGKAQSDAQAALWFREAAEQGHAPSQVDLGNLYSQGRGVTQGDEQAVSWFLKAAQQGDARGRLFLGNMYEAGRGGLPKDPVKAAGLYRQAAAQGNVAAQLMLAGKP